MSNRPDTAELVLLQALMNEKANMVMAKSYGQLDLSDSDADIVFDWMQKRIDNIKSRT